MNVPALSATLELALGLSRQLVQLADAGDLGEAVRLDTERRRLLRAACSDASLLGAHERELLAEIGTLNDRALGLLEHRQRIKARELDVAMAGRRAVVAYAATG